MNKVGTPCPCCKHPFYRNVYDGGDYVEEGCSDFCASQTDEVKAAFAALKNGDFGIWPCAECGCAVDDEYKPGAICSECYPKVARRQMSVLLAECMAHVAPELAQRIEETLKKYG